MRQLRDLMPQEFARPLLGAQIRRRMAVQRRQIEETDLGAIAELFSRGFRFDQ
jgi:hypothetical protein